MKTLEMKQKLTKELTGLHKKLNIQQLYAFPNHKDTKNWIAKTIVVFKDFNKSDYQKIIKLSKIISPLEPREKRKKTAYELDNFVRLKIAELQRGDFEENKQTIIYIKQEIIEMFINKQDNFNYKKLIRLLGELNSNYVAGYIYSSAMLIRAILDHIPPLLGFGSFEEVVKNYSWPRTDREYMKNLLDFKNEGDDVLHRQISQNLDLLDMGNLPNSNRINRLLQECLTNTVDINKSKQNQQTQLNQQLKTPRLEINILNSKVSWANYSNDFPSFTWSSFKIELEIDNYNNPQPDYISLALRSSYIDGIWMAENFIFLDSRKEIYLKPKEPYPIESKQVKRVEVLISDTEVGTNGQRIMPDIDRDKLELIVTTKSGQVLTIPIKAGWIRKG
jgi:hypothetical protein